MKHQFLFIAMALTVCSCNENKQFNYPKAEKQDVVDNYFGTDVADPYRWMENDTTSEVAAWVEAENKITNDYLAQIPFRETIKERLTNIVNYEKIGQPFKKNGKYYFFKNDGLQNQSILYEKETIDGEASVLLDPNKLSTDGTVALTSAVFSYDGKYLAYTIARSGSDWNEIYIMDLATRQLTDDHITWAKFTVPRWYSKKDAKGKTLSTGFFYSAYDAPEEGKEYSDMNEGHKVYYHTIGTEQSEDNLEYENKNYPKRFYTASIGDDERWLFISEDGYGDGNRLFLRDLNKYPRYIEIASNYNYRYDVIDVIKDKAYIITNYGAPKNRVMVADLNKPYIDDWKELVPEAECVLTDMNFIGGKMVLTYMRDASDHAYVYSMDGNLEYEIKFPSFGSVSFSGERDDMEAFYTFSSFTFPPTIYKFDIANNISEKYLSPKINFNPEEYVSEQVFFASKDGTRIPMFLTYKKGMQRDGSNPVYLYGYGGFNISVNPSFVPTMIPWMEQGGIYASVNLRGGSEYGEEWHQAGTKLNKQNVFDDCIAAAEWLIAENYTSSKKLCVAGGSNGGLLVGAVVNQRPSLFAVAMPAVGVMDMLRYHLFTIGWNWASDYGTSADDKEMFDYLHGYSPLHNIKNDGTPYPAILVTTADHDDRVVPAHSFKYTATLQAANTGDAPKLIRIETKAGHGGGKPMSKILEEKADCWAFIMHNLGMEIK